MSPCGGGRMEAAEPKKRMLSGGVFRPVFLFALPIMVGNFFLQLYITVDAVIVGRFLGSHSLAAVSVATPILFIVVFFLAGGCTGVSVLIAQIYGSGDTKKLKKTMSTALIFGALFTLELTALCLCGARGVLAWTKAPAELRDETMAYLNIVFAGLIFSFLYNYYASALRGIGNSKIPFVFQAAASALHIAMNLLFVGALGLGVRGSALATVLSQMFSSGACIYYVYRYEPLLALRRGDCAVDRAALGQTIGYSWASALQSIIVYVGRFLTQGCVNPMGADVVAGYNAATRIEAIVVMPYEGISTAESTFIAQNLGAGHAERVRAGVRASFVMNLAYVSVACTLVFRNAAAIMGIFVPDGSNSVIIEAGSLYLRPQSVYLALSAVDVVMQSFLRGLGEFRVVMVVSLLQIVLRVILSFWLVPSLGIPAIAHATAAGWVMIFFALIVLSRRRLRQIDGRLQRA